MRRMFRALLPSRNSTHMICTAKLKNLATLKIYARTIKLSFRNSFRLNLTGKFLYTLLVLISLPLIFLFAFLSNNYIGFELLSQYPTFPVTTLQPFKEYHHP